MKMDIPDKIIAARKTLNLGEKVTLKDIRTAYLNLAKQYHPDKSKEEGDEGKMSEISEAHSILMEYVNNYRYSLKLEEILNQNIQWRWNRYYEGDPLWGEGKVEKEMKKSYGGV